MNKQKINSFESKAKRMPVPNSEHCQQRILMMANNLPQQDSQKQPQQHQSGKLSRAFWWQKRAMSQWASAAALLLLAVGVVFWNGGAFMPAENTPQANNYQVNQISAEGVSIEYQAEAHDEHELVWQDVVLLENELIYATY